MNIFEWFRNRKNKIKPVLTVVPDGEKPNKDVLAYFTQGILVFLLVFGSIGGFLSAYDISYDVAAVAMVIGIVSLMLSAAYATGKKRWTNLAYLIIILLYVYIAMTKFWYINSGYYSIINRIYEVARMYFSLLNGTHYAEVVANSFTTVTYFTVFVGVILVLLLNIQLNYHSGIFRILILTIPMYALPAYFELTPKPVYLIFLLAGYLSVIIAGYLRVREKRRFLLKYVLVMALLVSTVVVEAIYILLPQRFYEAVAGRSAAKEASETLVSEFVLYGPAAILGGSSASTGVSGGLLSSSPMVRSDYETDLIVRFAPYSMESVYLKAFTGKDYEGNRWYSVLDGVTDDTILTQTIDDSSLLYNARAFKTAYEDEAHRQGRGVMEVTNVGANPLYDYVPYYVDYHETRDMDEDENTGNFWSGKRYVYYPSNRNVTVEMERPDESYLKVSESCYDIVSSICDEVGFGGSPEAVAGQIITYFEENYTYTLRPGYPYGESDFITFFLKRNKKGYCAHFASSAVMMFRYLGIPARYVEGYVFSYNDVIVDGEYDSTIPYGDYYDGYAPLGETGVITLEIPDANAHSWVEIYIEGKGWVVVDPTPAGSSSETESFWEVFGNYGNASQVNAGADENTGILGQYLEKAMDNLFEMVMIVAVLAAAVILSGRLLKKWRYGKLNEKEKIRFWYQKLCRKIKRKHPEFIKLQGINMQFEWIEGTYENAGNAKELGQKLSDVFFGPALPAEEYQNVQMMLTQFYKAL